MGKHAVLSASSSHRWIRCSGSPGLIARLSDAREIDPNRSSIYAEEGTAAHALAEMCIREGLAPAGFIGEYMVANGEGDYSHAVQEPEGGLFFEISEEMSDGVQTYLDVIAETKRKYPHAIVLVEKGVYPLEGWEDEMYGTADLILWDMIESKLIVLDFKYGAGHVVEAEWNSQTMTYGLGAMRLVVGEDGATAIDEVEMIIVQPRARHEDGPVRRFVMTGQALREWGGILRSAGEETKKADAALVPGDHCRWCAAAPLCPAQRRAIQEQARMDFSVPAPDEAGIPERLKLMLPDPENAKQLGAALDFLPLLNAWSKEVHGMGQARLERGLAVVGADGPYKLVRKRSNRRWPTPSVILESLKSMKGVTKDDYLEPPKLKSPAQLEKVKAIGKEWVKERAEKPDGGFTMVPATDGREPVLIPMFDVPLIAETAGEVPVDPTEADQARAKALTDNWMD